MQLRVTFCRSEANTDSFELVWHISDHRPARVWCRNLIHSLNNGYLLNPRYVGFPNSAPYYDSLRQQLNRCIEVINLDGRHTITERMPEKFCRSIANKIHHHFEVLRGPLWKPTAYDLASPPDVHRAVSGLNDLIHRLEAYERQMNETDQEKFKAYVTVWITKNGHPYPATPLRKADYQHFFLQQEFGNIVLHYAQIGKTWWEVFLDQDDEIFPEAILPLRVIRSSFDLVFEDTTGMDPAIWQRFYDFLRAKGQNPDNPLLGLGYCTIARLDRTNAPGDAAIIQAVNARPYIREVSLGSVFQGRFRPQAMKVFEPAAPEYSFERRLPPQSAASVSTGKQPRGCDGA